MGWLLKYCPSCKEVYIGPESKCPKCHSDLLRSQYDSDSYNALDEDEKKKVENALFGDEGLRPEEIEQVLLDASKHNTKVVEDPVIASTSDIPKLKSNPSVGKAIKVLAEIVLVLSTLGWIVMIGQLGFAIGVAGLLVSLLTGLLAYGIGEICTLLSSIDSKLGN